MTDFVPPVELVEVQGELELTSDELQDRILKQTRTNIFIPVDASESIAEQLDIVYHDYITYVLERAQSRAGGPIKSRKRMRVAYRRQDKKISALNIQQEVLRQDGKPKSRQLFPKHPARASNLWAQRQYMQQPTCQDMAIPNDETLSSSVDSMQSSSNSNTSKTHSVDIANTLPRGQFLPLTEIPPSQPISHAIKYPLSQYASPSVDVSYVGLMSSNINGPCFPQDGAIVDADLIFNAGDFPGLSRVVGRNELYISPYEVGNEDHSEDIFINGFEPYLGTDIRGG
jgi:hypothetical protein